MNKIFSINTILRLAAGAILAAALFGCANMGESPASSAGVTGGAGVGGGAGAGSGSATVSGSLCFSGAMPSEIAALVAPVSLSGATRQSFDISRSAFPQTPSASGLTITVYAEEVTESETKLSYNGTVTDDGSGNVSYTVGIPVTSGKKYRVHAVAKKDDEKVLFGTSDLLDFTENAEQFYTSCDITLGAGQSATGKGGVYLTVNVQGLDVSTAKMIYKPKGSTESISEYGSSGLGGNVRVFSVGFEEGEFDPISAIASGEYTMIFEFYSGAESSENLLYSFTENVSVFDRLVTDTWVKNGSEPWLTPSGTGIACKITSAMVDGFKLTDIYVDPYAATTTESGTFLNPKRSFTDALAMLQDASKGYTIFIKGTIGPQTIPDTLKNSGSGGGNTYAKSLTLCGAGDPDPSGVPTDIIDAAGAAGVSALTIATTVPVTIKNLKITGGRGTIKEVSTMGWLTISNACGGGIYLSAAGGSLTLGKGAYVSENTANASAGASSTKYGYGGGVFISAPGELNLLDGSVVSNNGAEINGNGGGIAIYDIDATGASCKLNIYDGALIEKNQATLNGGGIYLGNLPVDVAMSGGRISGNVSGISGGAIYGSSGTFTMTGGVIGDDSDSIDRAANYDNYTDATRLSDNANKAGGSGGAFSFANTSGGFDKFEINIYGGTIAYNCAQNDGGAFEFEGGNLTVQGAEIKWNGASGETSGGGGGAIYLGDRTKLHLGDCTITGNECYGTSVGGAICIPRFPDLANSPKTYLKGAVSIPSDDPKKNDIALTSDDDSLAYPSLYIEGKLTGSEPVARITPSLYSSDRQVLQLADGVTDVNFALECYKFAVTPQASATPAQEWAVAGDGYLAKVTTLTGTNIDGFTVADFNEGDKVVYAFDSSVYNDQIDAFTRKLYNKTENQNLSGKKVGEGSVLDFSKATNLTSLGFSWSNNGVFQPFDIILPPNFDTSKFSNQTFAWAIKNAKNVIATPKASGGLVSEDGVVYNKNKTTLFFYPGGKTATSFVVPDGVTTIPRNSFSYNIYLKNITLPEGVTSIAWNACCATSIESINVPSTVKTIANEAFSNSVTSLTFANPNGWKLGPVEAEATAVNSSSLSDPATAAEWYNDYAYNVTGATNSNGYKVLWHD
ncbi:MAG: leucine-rich repeat domain-containing protein [Treponema sp.]|nr:leucine-rich repeat domain-containing protein [Treponema sp.]